VVPLRLDVTSLGEIEDARRFVEEQFGRLDVLVNNAGAFYDASETATTVDLDYVHQAYELNLFGAWRMTQAFAPLLRRSEHPRIVNVSSAAGAFELEGGGLAGGRGTPGALSAYGTSKAALNALTVKLAAELREDGILVNAVCPGWTAVTPNSGGRPVEEGAAGIVWAASLPDDGPTGGFFRDREPLPW
jgi:NAD(P)-dependent dehydrogenase (short-subunit alcohol dehydrogenase family)